MEDCAAIVQRIVDSELGSSDRAHALSAFVAQYENLKQKVVQKLVDEFNNTANTIAPQELANHVTTLRLLARENDAMEPLYGLETLHRLMGLAGLSAPLPNLDSSVKLEALKCVINVTLKNAACMAALVQAGGHVTALQTVQAGPAHVSAMEAFALLKLLANCTLPSKSSESDTSTALVNDLLARGLLTCVRQWLAAAESQLLGGHVPLVLGELVRVMLHATIHWGVLGHDSFATDTRAPENHLQSGGLVIDDKYFGDLEAIIESLLSLLSAEAVPWETRENIVNAFLNVPARYIRILLHRGLHRTIDALCHVLAHQSRSEDAKDMVPTMILLSTIASRHGADPDPQNEQPRDYLLKKLFPNRDLARELHEGSDSSTPNMEPQGRQAATLGNAVISLMTSLDMAVKYSANELLFQLADEDPERFVKLTGFGNAVGLLAMRGLFGTHLNQ